MQFSKNLMLKDINCSMIDNFQSMENRQWKLYRLFKTSLESLMDMVYTFICVHVHTYTRHRILEKS